MQKYELQSRSEPREILREYRVHPGFQGFNELLMRMNAAKRKLEGKDVENMNNPYRPLQGKSGILASNYGAEIVTNAYTKIYELFAEFVHPEKGQKMLNTLSIAEAPGNFLLAMNHYMKTKHGGIAWNWLASSYREVVTTGSTPYLQDIYGIMRAYRWQWIYGTEGDGDITKPANLTGFNVQAMKFLHEKDAIIKNRQSRMGGNMDVMTSDVKYQDENPDYDDEEVINIPVNIGQIICSVLCLKPGGITIIKQFTCLHVANIAMMYLMTGWFKRVIICKPLTSKSANSEVYLVGIGFLDNISKPEMANLLNYLSVIREINRPGSAANPIPPVVDPDSIPDSFVDELYRIQKELIDLQIMHIEQMLEKKIKNVDPNKWIDIFSFEKLNPIYKLLQARTT